MSSLADANVAPRAPRPRRAGSVGNASTAAGSTTSKRSAFSRASASIPSHLLDAIIARSLSSVLAAPPRLPVAKNKEPLSLPTTTRNFRGFVVKSGPVFWFQDNLVATLMWDDWSWTAMWMLIWAVVALHPYLLLCAPTAILSFILIRTHQARYPTGKPIAGASESAALARLDTAAAAAAAAATNASATSQTSSSTAAATGLTASQETRPLRPSESLLYALREPTELPPTAAVRPALVPNPPHEGTIKYYENLRDIQNMMRMVIDGYEAVAPSVPYLNWSEPARTLRLLQLSLLTTLVTFFAAPYVPLRLVLLVAGEAAFLANHPWVLPALEGLTRGIRDEWGKQPDRHTTARQLRRVERGVRRWRAKLEDWIEEDALADEVLRNGWRNVEIFENERFVDPALAGMSAVDGGWSAHNLRFGERKPWSKSSDGWAPAGFEATGYELDITRLHVELEPGWRWVEGDEWRIDVAGDWSEVGTDSNGYVYTDADWQRASPYAYGHEGEPSQPPRRRIRLRRTTRKRDTSTSAGGGGGSGVAGEKKVEAWARQVADVARGGGGAAGGEDDAAKDGDEYEYEYDYYYDDDGDEDDDDEALVGSDAGEGVDGAGAGATPRAPSPLSLDALRASNYAETRRRRWLRRAVWTGA